jgi:hypothetical protein
MANGIILSLPIRFLDALLYLDHSTDVKIGSDSAAAAGAAAGNLFSSKGGLYHGLGTTHAALYLDGPAGTVDLACTAFHAIIGIDQLGLLFLDLENPVGANLDASAAS